MPRPKDQPENATGRSPSLFKERDVRRAVKAALAEKLKISGIAFGKDGSFHIKIGEIEKPTDDLDAELEEFRKRHDHD